MAEYLYHGSIINGIRQLKAMSTLHNTDRRGVYLTDNYPYSLFYIWDAKHNKKQEKHVTAWIKDGIVYYEEQFPDQLSAFYKGVSGYVYCIEADENFIEVENRKSMWFHAGEVQITKSLTIPDVYEEILKYAELGRAKIIDFEESSKERIDLLYTHIAKRIIDTGLLNTPECEDAIFYRTYFEIVWKKALKESVNGFGGRHDS